MKSRIIDSKVSLLDLELLKINDSSIFQSKLIFQVWRKTRKHQPFFTIIEDDKGDIIASLLAVIQKENIGFLGRFSSRSVIIGKPFYSNNDLSILEELLKAYNKYISNMAIYSQFRNLDEYTTLEKKVFRKYGFQYQAHLDILHDLVKPLPNQFAALHKGRRKNIRRAEREEVVFREISNLHEFNMAYELVVSTYKRVKLPMPDMSLFVQSYNQLGNQNVLKTFVAILNDEIIGSRIVLCYKDIIYDWYAGASEKHLDKYPNDFLPWKIMEWGSQNGYKTFDFGGAGKPGVPYGVRDHKLKFGGTLVEYGRFEKVHNRSLMIIGKLGLKIYRYINI